MKIQYVNPPKNPDGKWGNVKGTDGTVYFVSVATLNRFTAGMEITPTLEKQNWAGKVVEIIPDWWHPGGGGQQPPAQPTGQYQRPAPPPPPPPTYAPAYTPPPPPPMPDPPQTQYAPYTGGPLPDGHVDQSGLIFVTGVVGRAMGSGKFTASEIPVLVEAAMQAWNRVPH